MTTMELPRLTFPSVPRVRRETVRQLLRYGVVGGLGTVVSALLYLMFRLWWDAVPANLAALVLSTVASTEANRRFTFGGRPVDPTRQYLQNAGTVVFYAFFGSAVLVVLGDVVDEPTAVQESAAVAAASVLGGVLRFLVLRNWVFAARRTRVRQGGAVIQTSAAHRLFVATAALGGLLLSAAASCDTGSASAPTPAVTTAPALPVTSGGEGGDDHGGSGGSSGSGGGRRGGERGGEDHGGDG
jgi:putative flippase GtrA